MCERTVVANGTVAFDLSHLQISTTSPLGSSPSCYHSPVQSIWFFMPTIAIEVTAHIFGKPYFVLNKLAFWYFYRSKQRPTVNLLFLVLFLKFFYNDSIGIYNEILSKIGKRNGVQVLFVFFKFFLYLCRYGFLQHHGVVGNGIFGFIRFIF